MDTDLIAQLKPVLAVLERTLTLRVRTSAHPNQSELDELLEGLAQASSKVQIERIAETSEVPQFEILREGRPTGIVFRGVPGGHEFTSLILSILYADGKAKQPDEGILQRVRNIQGPIRLTTYVSLECENCPEVVQALNLMATHHADFRHEMVDGGLVPAEVERLGIQGVPAVICEGQLIHSGKIQFLDLLVKLEQRFGRRTVASAPRRLGRYDVVVVGGGPAGASAAIYSARKGLSTALVAERVGGQLQETKGIENMISIPYTEGAHLAANLVEHMGRYPIQVLEHRRVSRITHLDESGDKKIELEGGEWLEARTLIVATGAQWRQLGIPGEKEHIGTGVAFCAHCDGPFYKGKPVAVIGGGNSGVEAALDLAAITESVTLLEYNEHLKADAVLVEKLKATPNVKILTQAKAAQVLGDGRKVVGLEYQDRASGETRKLEVAGIFVQIGLVPNSQFLRGFLNLTPTGEVIVDERGRTSVPGVYAAGDVTTAPLKQIVIAMGDGAKVALSAFEDGMRTA